MINLKEETLSIVSETSHSMDDIDYCYIYGDRWDEESRKIYCKGDINTDALNFEYDDGFGGQEVYGFIVFKDGTWVDRREYDGSEWWEYQEKPKLKDN